MFISISNLGQLKHTIFCLSLFIFYPFTTPIHFIDPYSIKWTEYNEPIGKISFQYPNLTDWKINIKDDNFKEIEYIQISHVDSSSYVNISLEIIPLDLIYISKFFDFEVSQSSRNTLNPERLLDLFENYNKLNPNFSVFEKHSDKYTIDGNKAYGMLTKQSFGLGNTTGMLTLYSIDNKHNNFIEFKYIFDPNSYITYLPITEKILDSIRIKN